MNKILNVNEERIFLYLLENKHGAVSQIYKTMTTGRRSDLYKAKDNLIKSEVILEKDSILSLNDKKYPSFNDPHIMNPLLNNKELLITALNNPIIFEWEIQKLKVAQEMKNKHVKINFNNRRQQIDYNKLLKSLSNLKKL